MPGLGVMRAEIIPPGVQSTVMNLYRVPLNAVVVTGTKLGASYGWEAVGLMNAICFTAALAFHIGASRVSPVVAKGGRVLHTRKAPPPSPSKTARAATPARSKRAAASPARKRATSPRKRK